MHVSVAIAVEADKLHLAGEGVRLVMLGVPTSRLQEGTMKLKRGPPSKAQQIDVTVALDPVRSCPILRGT